MSISSRIREERERLGYTQGAFAEACGVSRRAQSTYESGERTPSALYLEQASGLGVDVTYVVTGTKRDLFKPEVQDLDLDILEATLANLYQIEGGGVLGLIWGTISPKRKARIVALLYRAFKASGKIDLALMEEAINLTVD